MDRNWDAQKALHPTITNEKIDKLARIASDHHALGFKVNGAGGGSAVILSSSGNEFALKKDIIAAGYQILSFALRSQGKSQVTKRAQPSSWGAQMHDVWKKG